MISGDGVAPGHVAIVPAAVVVSGLTMASAGLLATLAAVNADWPRRRVVAGILAMAGLAVVGGVWLWPVMERGSLHESAGFDLVLGALGGEPAEVSSARYRLARALSPVIGWACLPFFAAGPRPRWPWWSLVAIVPVGVAWSAAASRWIWQPLACGPCRRELPVLERLATELGPRGLVVLPVTSDGKREDVVAGLAELRVTLPALLDPEGVSREWGVRGIPSTFVIDRSGVIREHHRGYGPGLDDALRAELVALLDRRAP